MKTRQEAITTRLFAEEPFYFWIDDPVWIEDFKDKQEEKSNAKFIFPKNNMINCIIF